MSSKYEVVRKFSVGTFITLYEIDLRRQGGPVFYFTNNVFEERVPIRFNGHDYIQMPIAMDNIAVDSQGAPAQPTFQIATSGGPIAALMAQYRDLKKAYIRRYDTMAEFLDLMPDGEGNVVDNPDRDPTAILGLELFVVDKKNAADDIGAELQLVAPTDQEGVMLPLRIVRKRWCDSDYRVPDVNEPDGFYYFEPVDGGCPYRGAGYFDTSDRPTTKDKDRCSKMVTGCVARFGKGAGLPFGALPGIRSTQEAG